MLDLKATLERLPFLRCNTCKGRGYLHCWLCDAPSYDCLLCVDGVARCHCTRGEPYAAVTIETNRGPRRVTRKWITETLDAVGRDPELMPAAGRAVLDTNREE